MIELRSTDTKCYTDTMLLTLVKRRAEKIGLKLNLKERVFVMDQLLMRQPVSTQSQ